MTTRERNIARLRESARENIAFYRDALEHIPYEDTERRDAYLRMIAYCELVLSHDGD